MGCASSKEAELDKAKPNDGVAGVSVPNGVAQSVSATPATVGSFSSGLKAVGTDSAKGHTVSQGSEKITAEPVNAAEVVLAERALNSSSKAEYTSWRGARSKCSSIEASRADSPTTSGELPKVRVRTHRASRSSHRNLPLPEEWTKGVAGCTHPGLGRAGVNQDAYTTHVFRDNEGQVVWLSAVFDGHGPDGEKCAQTCAAGMRGHFEEQSSTQLQMGAPTSIHLSVGNHALGGAMKPRYGGSVNHVNHGTGNGDDVQQSKSSGSYDARRAARAAQNRIFRDAEERVMHMTFLAMEEEVQEECNAFLSGSTCSACLVKKGAAWLATVGDSTSLLVSCHEGGRVTTTVMSPEHRLTNEDELKRVIAAGARVAKRPNQTTKGHLRIWLQEADSPGLMVTRSLGDAVGKSIGVTWEPDIMRVQITGKDKFIVMASDGVWDVLSNEQVASIVMASKEPEAAAAEIVEKSLKAWEDKKQAFAEKYKRTPSGIGDNITAIVVDLALWAGSA